MLLDENHSTNPQIRFATRPRSETRSQSSRDLWRESERKRERERESRGEQKRRRGAEFLRPRIAIVGRGEDSANRIPVSFTGENEQRATREVGERA